MTARFQHSMLAYNPERGPLSPDQLAGKRVGMRSYSVTTATWVRGILADDYGVDLGHGALGDLRGSARRGVPRPAERHAHAARART